MMKTIRQEISIFEAGDIVRFNHSFMKDRCGLILKICEHTNYGVKNGRRSYTIFFGERTKVVQDNFEPGMEYIGHVDLSEWLSVRAENEIELEAKKREEEKARTDSDGWVSKNRKSSDDDYDYDYDDYIELETVEPVDD